MYQINDIFLFLTQLNPMKKKLSYFSIVLFTILCNRTFSQENNTNSNEFLIIHQYTFEGNLDQNKIDLLELSLSKIEFVVEAKIKYKLEKKTGLISLVVRENNNPQETHVGFSPTSIKQIILQNGLVPNSYSISKYDSK